VWYNAALLLLEQSATENDMLARASLIAHETAHMWFGNLVTMRWFNDVWMKEVFANFMAAKIVNPAFPRVNHDLRFLVAHYPAAYSVDRTAGTHPIRQDLANLDEAGSLYGPIIYQKAPIVMRQLERLIGVERMQAGLRSYLKTHQFGNAAWPDLVRILDEQTPLDVSGWSRVWVEDAGRPAIRTDVALDSSGRLERLTFVEALKHRPQRMEVLVGTAAAPRTFAVDVTSERVDVAEARGLPAPAFILPTGGGLAYGGFALDPATRRFLLAHAPTLTDPVSRGAVWVTLWDEMLEGRIRPPELLAAILVALPRETVEQNVQLTVGYADALFWRFLSPAERARQAPALEAALLAGLNRAGPSSLKATYFQAFRSTVTTGQGLALLERVWRRQERIPGLILGEPDEATLALELAVRPVARAGAILEEQRGRFKDPDRRARFEFVMPAVSGDRAARDRFFEGLRSVENRRREPWVVEGLRYLNHPLRADAARGHLGAALELLAEIRQTGDIFFPKNWMDAVLSGHNTPAAADTVKKFLADRPDYPLRLRRVILQAGDGVFRAAAILSGS
jgi:aminopeptidase N